MAPVASANSRGRGQLHHRSVSLPATVLRRASTVPTATTRPAASSTTSLAVAYCPGLNGTRCHPPGANAGVKPAVRGHARDQEPPAESAQAHQVHGHHRRPVSCKRHAAAVLVAARHGPSDHPAACAEARVKAAVREHTRESATTPCVADQQHPALTVHCHRDSDGLLQTRERDRRAGPFRCQCAAYWPSARAGGSAACARPSSSPCCRWRRRSAARRPRPRSPRPRSSPPTRTTARRRGSSGQGCHQAVAASRPA